MTELELLAPARNADIGIAAIDCGADAVYIAGPDFGARKAAGNDFEEIGRLCRYAHQFGARIFLTVNTTVEDCELEEVHSQMLRSQEAGVDAFIIRDPRIAQWDDITVELHASTQCAIRDVETALYYESIGCSRIILERQLSLDQVRRICSAVHCEVEFFVHGALCVCYSGDCTLSEYINGRSADKGDCIQACRSLYDLVDDKGKTLVRGKALLSLKDYNLKDRLGDLAEAGVYSFKIEGRLKSASYVRNVVREYDLALNRLIATRPGEYCRASHGHVSGGFIPDSTKTFNRGYTELFLDGKKGRWSSMDAPKSIGEAVGTVVSVTPVDRFSCRVKIRPLRKGLTLRNGDGFAFLHGNAITGFRADVCEGTDIICKNISELKAGVTLCRNIDAAFEKEMDAKPCRREISVRVDLTVEGRYRIVATAVSEDGRTVTSTFNCDDEKAENTERMLEMLRSGLSKRSGIFSFKTEKITVQTPGETLPLLSASVINGIRRCLSEDISSLPCPKHTSLKQPRFKTTTNRDSSKTPGGKELMRSKYCIKYELGLCTVHQGAADPGRLFLVNNGRKFALGFDCARCEMTVSPAQK